MRNLKIIIFFALIISVSICYFIKKSNDHIECDTVTSKKINKNGNVKEEERHVCKENYSF
jgi:hypothetical protein